MRILTNDVKVSEEYSRFLSTHHFYVANKDLYTSSNLNVEVSDPRSKRRKVEGIYGLPRLQQGRFVFRIVSALRGLIKLIEFTLQS